MSCSTQKRRMAERAEVQAVRQQILPRRVWRFLTDGMNLRLPFVYTGEQLIHAHPTSDALNRKGHPDSADCQRNIDSMATAQSPVPNKYINENPTSPGNGECVRPSEALFRPRGLQPSGEWRSGGKIHYKAVATRTRMRGFRLGGEKQRPRCSP